MNNVHAAQNLQRPVGIQWQWGTSL